MNEFDISKSLDIVAVNPYHHAPQDEYDGEDSSYQGDYGRSLKHTNYLVTETNADTIGWDSKSQFPPYDGKLRLDVYTHLSSGANMVEYILLVGVVALIAIAGFKLFGGKVKDKIQEQGNSVGGINGQAQ